MAKTKPTSKKRPIRSEERSRAILAILEDVYREADCGLLHDNPFELLIATILSAQTTDKQVNKVTPDLFARYPDASAMALAEPEDLYPYVHSCGFYETKARNIVAASRMLMERFGGKVPRTREEITELPGVGRKTANVVLSNCFGADYIAVDTHVFRVANRLGLADAKNEKATEEDLEKTVPLGKRRAAHHWLIWHGRQICAARRPRCEACPLQELCPWPEKEQYQETK